MMDRRVWMQLVVVTAVALCAMAAAAAYWGLAGVFVVGAACAGASGLVRAAQRRRSQ